MMQIIQTEHSTPPLLRSKHLQISKFEEQAEFDHRQYRYLLSVFADNLNLALKLHKNCLGEMEYHPKYKISREEQQGYETSLSDIYLKYSSKILKESVYRNTFIRKSCETYLGQYEKVYPPTTQTEPNIVKRNTPSMGLLRKMTSIDSKKAPSMSVKSQTRKTVSSVCTQDRLLYLSQTFKAFQAELSMTLKLKTISSQNNPESKDCFLRTTRSVIAKNQRQRLKSDQFPQRRRAHLAEKNLGGCQEMVFKGNQILISELKKPNNQEWESQKEVPFHSKFCTRRVVAIGQQKKLINEIQILHMQTKNIETPNNVFWPAADLAHRPKLKRWQHSFS